MLALDSCELALNALAKSANLRLNAPDLRLDGGAGPARVRPPPTGSVKCMRKYESYSRPIRSALPAGPRIDAPADFGGPEASQVNSAVVNKFVDNRAVDS